MGSGEAGGWRNFMELGIDMTEDLLSKALSHTFEEVGFPSMKISLENNFEEIQKAHDSIHEFMYLASLYVPFRGETGWYYSKSAFITYHSEAFHSAHRSFLEALAGYYNPAYTLLRNTLELLVRGAFWENLAHKKFRNNTKILDEFRDNKKRKSVKYWIEDIIKQEPSIEKDFEETSVAIFDKIAIFFEDRGFQNKFIWMPSFSLIINQLLEWKIIDIPEAHSVVYGLYKELSNDVHVIPDKTDVGRRLLQDKKIFETTVDLNELSKFLKILHKIMDIGIVIELNILSDWIEQDEKVKTKLEERISVINELGLKHSSEKLESLVKI